MGVRIWDNILRPVFTSFTGYERIALAISEFGSMANRSTTLTALKEWIQGTSSASSYLPYANVAAFPNPGEFGVFYLALDTEKIYRWTGALPYEEVSPPESASLQNKYRVISGSGTISTWYSDYQTALAATGVNDRLEMYANATLTTGSIFKNGLRLTMNGYNLIVGGSLDAFTGAVVINDYGIITSTAGTINIATGFTLNAPLVRCVITATNGDLFTCTTNGTAFLLNIGAHVGSLGSSLVRVLTMSAVNNAVYIRGGSINESYGPASVGKIISGTKIQSITINIGGDYSTNGTNGMLAFTDASSNGITVRARNYNGEITSIDGTYYLQDVTGASFANGGVLNTGKGTLYCRNILLSQDVQALSVFNMAISCQDIINGAGLGLTSVTYELYARYLQCSVASPSGAFWIEQGSPNT